MKLFLFSMSALGTLSCAAVSLGVFALSVGLVLRVRKGLKRRRLQAWLTSAILDGDVDGAMVALDRGADPNREDDGWVPLHLAVDTPELFHRLLERGADVDVRTSSGATVLHTAAAAGDVELVRWLLDDGQKVDALDRFGRRPFDVGFDVAVRTLLVERRSEGLRSRDGQEVACRIRPADLSDVDADRGCLGKAHGAVWFGGYEGLFRYDGHTVEHYQLPDGPAVAAIAEGRNGKVYVATNQGLFELDGERVRRFTALDSPLVDTHLLDVSADADGLIYAIGYERESTRRHVSVFDGERWSLLRPGIELPDAAFTLHTIAFDTRDRMILGTSEGLWVERAGRWVHDGALGRKSMFAADVRAVAVDGDTLWLGTQDGLVRRRRGRFDVFEGPLVQCVAVSGEKVYAGTYFEGLMVLEQDELRSVRERDGLPHDDVIDLAVAGDGTVWIRCEEGLAVAMNGEVAPV